MIGFSPGHPKTAVKHVKPPLVRVGMKALSDMAALVDIVDSEVGWLGTVEVMDNMDFIIHEIFLPKQNVHLATTEIDPEGYAELVTELIAQRTDGVKVANSIRFWGHSHVNMGVFPSGQDEDQLRSLVQDAEDYFIAARANKHGSMRFDIQYASGIQIDDLPWEPYLQDDETLGAWRTQVEAKVKPLIETGISGMWDGAPFDELNWGSRDYQEESNEGLPWDNAGKSKSKSLVTQSGVAKPRARLAYPVRRRGREGKGFLQPTSNSLQLVKQLDWSPNVDSSDIAFGIDLALSHNYFGPEHYQPRLLKEGAETFIDWAGRTRPLEEITDTEMEAAGFMVQED